MLDSQRAMVLYLLGTIPMVLALFLYMILGTPPRVEYSIIIIALALGGVVYTLIFRFHPLVQHYLEAQHVFDRIYLYIEEEAQ